MTTRRLRRVVYLAVVVSAMFLEVALTSFSAVASEPIPSQLGEFAKPGDVEGFDLGKPQIFQRLRQ